VFIVILLLAVSLFLPAISRVSGPTMRLGCANHLKQMALSVLAYHDVYGTFPSGTIANPALSPEERLSWHVAILPFMEQDRLYKQIALDLAWEDARNRDLVQCLIREYGCPTSELEWANDRQGLTNYVGIAGLGQDAASLPKGNLKVGFFGYDRIIRIGDLWGRRGASNTLAIVETGVGIGPWAAGGPSTARGVVPEEQPYFGKDAQFGGFHKSDRDLFHWV